jgi:hypothetical protein
MINAVIDAGRFRPENVIGIGNTARIGDPLEPNTVLSLLNQLLWLVLYAMASERHNKLESRPM